MSSLARITTNQRTRFNGDRFFQALVIACAIFVIFLLIGVTFVLVVRSTDTINRYGLSFFTNAIWDPVPRGAGESIYINGEEQILKEAIPGMFGALPFIYGTVVTSILALLIAAPFAVGAAIFVSEYSPRRIGDAISFTIELLVAIPSVAYGVFGFLVLKDIMRDSISPFLRGTIGQIPVIGTLFSGQIFGLDLFTASVVLAVMILPTILAVSREIIRQVPRLQKEGMVALGATKWEAIRFAIIPYARSGIIGGAMLGLARGIGETMAVTMTIGNGTPSKITGSLFQSTSSLASAIANQFGEAQAEKTYGSAIIELGLVLLIVSSVINIGARLLVSQATKKG
jgi:phosphate transport system permease protein